MGWESCLKLAQASLETLSKERGPLGPFRNAAIQCAAPGRGGLQILEHFPSTLNLMKHVSCSKKKKKKQHVCREMGNNQNTLCCKMLQFLFLIPEEQGFIKQRMVRLPIAFGSGDVSTPCYLQQSQRQRVARGSWALENLTQKMMVPSKTFWESAGLISALLLPCDEMLGCLCLQQNVLI